MLTSFPSALVEWAQPGAWGVVATLLAVNWLETKASEARLNQRIDELRDDMKELRADNRTPGEKIDRMLEAFFAVKQA